LWRYFLSQKKEIVPQILFVRTPRVATPEYFLGHPHQNPLPLAATMLLHVYCEDVLLILTPFSKIVHCIILSFFQFFYEIWVAPGFWHGA